MRSVEFELGGQKFYLAYNIRAMYKLAEIGEMEKIVGDPVNCLRAFAILAEQGELVRREYGYDSAEIYDVSYFDNIAQPRDLLDIQSAVLAAVTLGVKREIDDGPDQQEQDGVVDLSLQKLQKKTDAGRR